MFYGIVKIWVRLALKLFCSHITINQPGVLQTKGPLLLAANHPDSFLDAIIIGSRFKQPVHFLARGDAFRKPLVKKLLTALKLIPIYRLSEGREYLALNDATFEQCRNILHQGGIVLIFSEGLCVNGWKLRSLKKGTARIAFSAWKQTPIRDVLKVIPVSLNYHSFNRMGKQLIIHFGDAITKDAWQLNASEGENIQSFNQLLVERLTCGMLQPANDNEKKSIQFLISNHQLLAAQSIVQSLQKKQESLSQLTIFHKLQAPFLIEFRFTFLLLQILFIVIAFPIVALSSIFHFPLYMPVKSCVKKKTKDTVFYDSVLFALLLLLYPVWLLLFVVLLTVFTKLWWLKILSLMMPVMAWIHIQWNDSLQRISNYFRLSKKEREAISRIRR